MHTTRTGIILYVQRYAECVAFYREILGLEILFSNPELACFAFGGSYLMVEVDDREPPAERPMPPQAFCLRLNVPNVRERANGLIAQGVAVDYQEHAWGTVAKFVDPDGNLCALKDDATFERQVADADG